MACSLCHSTEANDRRNAASVPLAGAMVDRVRRALAIADDARCFAGPLPRMCARCVSNIETIESALTLRGKMRQMLDLPASVSMPPLPLPASVATTEPCAVVAAAGFGTRLDAAGLSATTDRCARSPGRAHDARAEAPAVVTEADSSSSVQLTDDGLPVTDQKKLQSGDDKEKRHSGLSAGEIRTPTLSIANHASAASAVVADKMDPAGTDVAANTDAGIMCTVSLPRKEPVVKVELDESSGGAGRSIGEGTSSERERQRSAVSATATPPAAGRDINGSSIARSGSAALASPPERLLRSSAAAAVAGVATMPLDAPISLHQLQPLSRKAARSSGSSSLHSPAAAVGDDSLPSLVAAASSWSSTTRASGGAAIGGGGRRRPLSRAGGVGSVIPALVVCRHCGKGFNSYSVLRVHLRSHTGEKPFTCRHCGVGFTQSQHARSHERRVHERTDGKQFRCSTCNAAYWRLGMLKAHERIHTAAAVAAASQQQQPQHRHNQLPSDGALLTPSSVRSGAAQSQVHRGGRMGGRSGSGLTTPAPALAPLGLAAAVTTPPYGATRSSGRKRAASAVQRRAAAADAHIATYRRSAAADRMCDSWYDDASSNDGFDSDDELACGSNGSIGISGGCGDNDSLRRGAKGGMAASMVADQSKRYCCDQCDDAFWKVGHLLRHKTLVHSSVDGVTADGSAEPLSVFGDHTESVEATVDAASASTSSSTLAAHRASDLADHVAESSSDELDHSRAADAAVLVGDGQVAAAGVSQPVACPQQTSSLWPVAGSGRKPRKRLKTVQTLTNYVDGHDGADVAVLPAAGVLDDPSSKSISQDEADISFQSSSVFPRGDHDWAELSGISLSSVAGQTSAAIASPVRDGTLSVSSPMPIDDWGLKCTECNEQFAFKLGLQRHIRTVHLRKNQYACGVCTASFMLEKTLKHHVENAHPGRSEGTVDEAGVSMLKQSEDAATILDGKRFVLERDVRGRGSASIVAGRQDGRVSSAAGAKLVASVAVNVVGRPEKVPGRSDATVRSASADVASDSASPAPTSHGARPDVGLGVGGTGTDGFGYRCKECSSTFRSKAVLRAHVRVHQASDEFPYGCDVCGARFMAEKYLTQHAVVHGEKQFECKVCRLRFSRRASLMQHVTCSHAGQCDYACDSCTATFNNPTALTKHKHRMHSDDHYDSTTAILSVAGAAEAGDVPGSPSQLRDQQLVSSRRSGSPEAQLARNHRQQSSPSGGAVGQVGTREATNAAGGVVYPPARFFECETCRSSFGSLSALSLHKHRVHGVLTPRSAARASAGAGGVSAADDERGGGVSRLAPGRSAVASSAATGGGGGNSHLHCHLCNRKFSSMSSRAAHMRLHTGERPYACTVCGRRFVQSVHLKSHMRLHTGEKPYVCSVCGMAHRHRSGFMKHMRNHHGAPAVEMNAAAPLGRNSRRASLGRTRTESATGAIVGRATTGGPHTRGSASSLLDGGSESQSDLSRDFADERDSCGDSIADGDGTRRSESSASTLPPGGDATDVTDHVCDTCHEILPSTAALSSHMATMHASRVVRDGSSGSQKSFSCSKCGERFGLKFLLKQHMKKRHRLVMAE